MPACARRPLPGRTPGSNSIKILLLGKNGQVGWELQRALAPLGERPDDEHAIRWNDPTLNIHWPISRNTTPALSRKDAIAVLTVLVGEGLVSLGTKKAEKEEVFLAKLDILTARFHEDIGTLGAVTRVGEQADESEDFDADEEFSEDDSDDFDEAEDDF